MADDGQNLDARMVVACDVDSAADFQLGNLHCPNESVEDLDLKLVAADREEEIDLGLLAAAVHDCARTGD